MGQLAVQFEPGFLCEDCSDVYSSLRAASAAVTFCCNRPAAIELPAWFLGRPFPGEFQVRARHECACVAVCTYSVWPYAPVTYKIYNRGVLPRCRKPEQRAVLSLQQLKCNYPRRVSCKSLKNSDQNYLVNICPCRSAAATCVHTRECKGNLLHPGPHPAYLAASLLALGTTADRTGRLRLWCGR